MGKENKCLVRITNRCGSNIHEHIIDATDKVQLIPMDIDAVIKPPKKYMDTLFEAIMEQGHSRSTPMCASDVVYLIGALREQIGMLENDK